MTASTGRAADTSLSPLGTPDEIAAVRSSAPALVPLIDELEDLVAPEFARAEEAAVAARRAMSRRRLVELAGGAAVTSLGLARLSFGDGARWCSAAAGLIAAVLSATAASRGRAPIDEWLDQRRIAEELRSLYFRHLVRPRGSEAGDRRRAIRDEVVDVLSGRDPRRRTSDAGGAAPQRSVDTLETDAWRVYADRRLRDQIRWMTAKSEAVGARTNVFGRMQLGLMVVAALFSFVSALFDGQSGRSLAVLGAAAAGMVTIVAAVDAVVANDRLATHYQRTARRLEVIERSIGGLDATSDDIDEIESVLMAEHRSWQTIAQEGDG